MDQEQRKEHGTEKGTDHGTAHGTNQETIQVCFDGHPAQTAVLPPKPDSDRFLVYVITGKHAGWFDPQTHRFVNGHRGHK